MRQGLVNASGTNLQLHGAAHGTGIYLSPLAMTSFHYCGGSAGLYTFKNTQDANADKKKTSLSNGSKVRGRCVINYCE